MKGNENPLSFSQTRPMSFKAIKKAMKDRLRIRVGDRAVYEMMNVIDDCVDLVSVYALQNLEKENELRREQGMEERKTLQSIDIKRAHQQIILNEGADHEKD